MPVLVKIPKKLEETLGEKGSKEFIDFMNVAFDDHKGDIIRESELRFEAILIKEISALRTEFKGDTASLRAEFKEEISSLRAVVKEDIANVKTMISQSEARLIKWFVGAAIAQIAIILSVLSLVIK